MIPLLALKPAADFLKAIPREAWYLIGVLVLLLILRSHWIGVGKDISDAKIAEVKAELSVCHEANKSNLDTINQLKDANALYASESAKQLDKLGKVQKDAKTAQKRADALEKALQKDKQRAYENNPEWATAGVPADIKRLFDRADQN
jgi:hypothetical protein